MGTLQYDKRDLQTISTFEEDFPTRFDDVVGVDRLLFGEETTDRVRVVFHRYLRCYLETKLYERSLRAYLKIHGASDEGIGSQHFDDAIDPGLSGTNEYQAFCDLAEELGPTEEMQEAIIKARASRRTEEDITDIEILEASEPGPSRTTLRDLPDDESPLWPMYFKLGAWIRERFF